MFEVITSKRVIWRIKRQTIFERVASLIVLSCLGFVPAEKAFGNDTEALGHSFSEYNFATEKSGPSIVKIDSQGRIWLAMARAGKIGRWDHGDLREYTLPAGAFPVGVVLDSAGQVWYSDIRRNKIGRLDPETGAIRSFDIPSNDSWPFFVVIDHQGVLWFTERTGNNIGRLDPRTGKVVEFPVPTKNAQPAGMAISPDGDLFFTENSGNKLGRLNPASGKITEYVVPTPMTPSPFYGLAGVASDASGNIWFAEVDGRLGLLPRDRKAIEEIPVPNPASRPAGVTVDSWGIIWFTELDGNCISSYDPVFHEFRRYPIPTGSPDPRPMGPPETTARGEIPNAGMTARTSRPFGIAVDDSGRVWFSEQYAHKFGVLTVPAVEVFSPRGLVTGPYANAKVRIRLPNELRHPHSTKINYQIDGQDVPPTDTLDVARLAPGLHRFAVTAREGSGQIFKTSTAFSVSPTLATVKHLLVEARPPDINPLFKRDLQQMLRAAENRALDGDTEKAREIARSLIQSLLEPKRREYVSSSLSASILVALRYVDSFGTREYAVRVLDGPPYFEPRHLTIEVGDVVTFTYRPKISQQLRVSGNSDAPHHVLAWRNGDFAPTQLNAKSSSWSRTYTREGEYVYLCSSHASATGAIFVKPRTTDIHEFSLAGSDRVPGVLAIDGDDNVWFTEGGGGFLQLADIPLNNKIGKLSSDGRFSEYATPTAESGPTSIHLGKEGHIWFTERGGNKIGELNPGTGNIREYNIPTPLSVATGITVDPAGKVWYAGKMSSKIGVLDPATSKIVEYDTPTPNSQPSTIVADGAGVIWFDERANDKIARFDPASGEMKEYVVPTAGSRVVGIVPASNDGKVWFLELGANKVGELDPETGMVIEHAIPSAYSSPFKEALDSDGRLWFTEVFGNKVGVLQPDGRFFEFAIPTLHSMPGGIAVDSKGNVWFTEQAANKVAMVSRPPAID